MTGDRRTNSWRLHRERQHGRSQFKCLSSDPGGRRKPDDSSLEVWNVVECADGKRRPSLGARLSRGGLGVPDKNLIWFIGRADETYVTLMLWKPSAGSAASVPP